DYYCAAWDASLRALLF
nr:immunoglobulin light chain junction region [Macaca mulatta]MOX17050.1 immunoglobulin light chain junction region [Macaca mulatta]MOX17073.1 immunoglobulin light chain junction region [Macaca mulatta]MOX17174.1 immunoglobulin light chain junction region [Macaca mulatta]MOX17313.1 immunoglobulin light chain junction region [Macaca mulatta]